MAKRKHYKSIEFDLDTKKLQEYYSDYRTAYKDIRRFMTNYDKDEIALPETIDFTAFLKM